MVLEKVASIVEQAAKSNNNFFTYTAWSHHIVLVKKYAEILAAKLGADRDVVVLGALLHDYSCLLDKENYPEHHMHSARIAKDLLLSLQYDDVKTGQVIACIEHHRGSVPRAKMTLEERIVADADAMSHFEAVDDLFHLAYSTLKLKTDEGRDYVLNKLLRSWNKMSDEAQEIIKPKYELIKKLFLDKSNSHTG